MTNKVPSVGDTVVVRGVVEYVDAVCVQINTRDDALMSNLYLNIDRIYEIIPKPWTPVVGGLARYCSSTYTSPATILAIAEGHAMLRFNDNSVGTVRVSSLLSPVPSAV